MKLIGVALLAAAAVAAAAVILVAQAPAAQQMQTVWCKAVQPGAQYESNDVRYTSVLIGSGLGLDTPAQGCASMDGWQTYVPAAAP